MKAATTCRYCGARFRHGLSSNTHDIGSGLCQHYRYCLSNTATRSGD
jgi:hypothetical protein